MIVAVTGHRPLKLGGYGEDVQYRLVNLAKRVLLHSNPRPDTVVTGMAQGWDQAVAEACIDLKIPFIAAIPCLGQERMWPQAAQDRYWALRGDALCTVHMCSRETYAPALMHKRNEWMVDQCKMGGGYLLALWDGTSGGTANCVRYAREQGVEIRQLWNDWVQSTEHGIVVEW